MRVRERVVEVHGTCEWRTTCKLRAYMEGQIARELSQMDHAIGILGVQLY